MAWRGLHISTPARLSIRNRQILIEQDEAADGLAFPLEDIAWIILDTPQVTVSGSLLGSCAESGIAMVVPDARHHPAGILLSFHQHHAQSGVAHDQIAMSTPLKKRLWQKIVVAKIENQAAVLRSTGSSEADALTAMAVRVRSGDPDNREAVAARAYWSHLFEGFRRQDDDRRNGLLNYGYAVMRAALARACTASGLLPAFGIHHCSRTNAFNLVDDLLEPFRPVVDQRVVRRVQEVQREDLDIEDRRHMAGVLGDSVLINDESMTVLAATETVTASMIRTINASNAASLSIPAMSLARRSGHGAR